MDDVDGGGTGPPEATHAVTKAPIDFSRLPAPLGVYVRLPNWLGDVVMAIPVLSALRAERPDAHLAVQVAAPLAPLFDGFDWINEVLPLPCEGGTFRKLAATWREAHRLRERPFDLALVLPNSFGSALIPFLARIPLRVGYRRDGRGALLTHPVPALPQDREPHRVHYFLGLLPALGVSPAGLIPRLSASPAALLRAHELVGEDPRPIVGLAPGAAYGPSKRWPAEHFAETARLLLARGRRCVLLGGPGDDAAVCRQVFTLVGAAPPGVIDLGGKTSVAELLAVTSLLSGFVGNDSGAAHVAWALEKPAVLIFGMTPPALARPLSPNARYVYRALECSPCWRRECPYGHYRCVRLVPPKEVASLLEEAGG